MKGKFWRKALAAALALLIVSGSVPIKPISDIFESVAITASAEGNTINIEANGQTISDTTTWTDCTVNITGSGTVTFSNRITISGTVTLNLGEGTTLAANHGIAVHEGNSLTIDGEGNLTANSDTYSEAAIGGSYSSPNAGTITISGGTINASNNSKGVSAAIGGGYSSYGGNGTIIINGGTITTNIIQGGAASIGGSKGANGGHITIAGGSITANRSGAVTGAGIGGGEKGNAGTIIISGGTVTVPASSSARGAGIGGGEKSDGEGSITINDGNITAVGGAIGGSAGIGGGSNSSAGTITITGGVVNATGGYESAGIGGARGVNGSGGTIAISGGQVTARGSDGAYGIGPSKDGAEGTISMSWTDNTDFIDASYAGTITILKGKRFFYDETEMFAKAEGLYKQEKKIIPAVLDNSLLSSGEILMQRNFVTTEGTAVDVSYDVYDYNGDKLTDGTDYTAVIKNSNDQIVTTFDQLGDYTLTVTGMGNYSGSNSYTFSLVEWDMALMQDGSEHYVNLPENGTKTVYLNVGQSIKVYDSEGKDGKLVASDGRLLLHVPTGYALVVSGKTDAMTWNEAQHDTTNFLSAYENENFTDEITSLFGNSNNISFASAGNSMLIRLNAQKIYRYDDQYGLELTISVQKSLTHSDITIATIPDQTYSRSEICPAVIVNDGETKLTLGTDYTVEYSDNVSAGTAKITITGAGDYTGSILKTFEILKAEPTMVKAPTAVENLVFNGNEQELVTEGSTDFGTVLYSLDGTNYSEEVPKGTNAGKYTVYYKVDTDNYYYAPKKVEVTIAESYTITWKNGDETLETDNYVPGGATPEYNGETPTKDATAQYTYTFSGWSPEISSVSGDVTYTAQFTATARRGDCGANATWCFDPDTGKLIISGTGAMYNYSYYTQPWYNYKVYITSVVIENGITSIGNFAFDSCAILKSITISDSVTSIGDFAFQYCTSLTSVTIPDSVESIGIGAFSGCTGLTSITIPDSVESIGSNAFYKCTNITDVYCYADPANLTWNERNCDDFKSDGTTVCHVREEHIDTYNSEKFSIVNVRFVGDLVDMGLGEHLYGHSITLDGGIGVNFYVELTDELLASDTAQMVFTVPNGSKTDTQTLLVKDVIANDKNKVSIGSRTYYKFKCSVSAKDMASEITAQLIDGEKSGKEYTYSVKDYAEYILEHNEVEEYANAAPLVKAMLNYGAASQTYFGIEGTAANASLDEADKELGEVSIDDTFKFNDENSVLPEGVTFEGATLSLKSETTFSLYFKGLPEGTEFTCDGKTVETAKNGEYVVARIRGIKANELENDFTVKFGESSETYNVKYNVMTYCYNVLNDGTVDDNLKNVCKALYKYAQAAKTYSE